MNYELGQIMKIIQKLLIAGLLILTPKVGFCCGPFDANIVDNREKRPNYSSAYNINNAIKAMNTTVIKTSQSRIIASVSSAIKQLEDSSSMFSKPIIVLPNNENLYAILTSLDDNGNATLQVVERTKNNAPHGYEYEYKTIHSDKLREARFQSIVTAVNGLNLTTTRCSHATTNFYGKRPKKVNKKRNVKRSITEYFKNAKRRKNLSIVPINPEQVANNNQLTVSQQPKPRCKYRTALQSCNHP